MVDLFIAIGINAIKFVLDKPITSIALIVIAYLVYRVVNKNKTEV